MDERVVIAGGGVAGLEALLALRALAGDSLDITLLAAAPEFVYRPLATGDPFVITHVQRRPLAQIADEQRATLRTGTLERVDAEARRAFVAGGGELPYDFLVVAVGARPYPALEHALTFRGPEDVEAVHGLVQDVEGGYVARLAFVVPSRRGWPLPMYELALMTAERAHSMFVTRLELTLITCEERPLELFGREASDAVAALLEESNVELVAGARAEPGERGSLTLPSGRTLHPERVVAAPLLAGPAIRGLPADEDGFIPVDEHCRVVGTDRVYAAGDATDFPIKQGGIGAQQADAAAEAIAREVGAAASAAPFRPILRGMLLTGSRPRYMRADTSGAERSILTDRPLWWPPDKIAGRYLAPYLGGPAASVASREMLPVEHPLEAADVPEAYRRYGHFAPPPERG
jgi:sulfide:quinone oxidoreductase